jgi:hypothetical protein
MGDVVLWPWIKKTACLLVDEAGGWADAQVWGMWTQG